MRPFQTSLDAMMSRVLTVADDVAAALAVALGALVGPVTVGFAEAVGFEELAVVDEVATDDALGCALGNAGPGPALPGVGLTITQLATPTIIPPSTATNPHDLRACFTYGT